MTRITRTTLLLVLVAFPVAVFARQAPPPGEGDPLAEFLFPPELIMKYQKDLKLTADQRETIKQETVTVQTRFLSLQWDLQEAMEGMKGLLQAEPVDEEAALTQLQKILDLEREVKRAQLSLAVRIRNALTKEQRHYLQRAREQEEKRR